MKKAFERHMTPAAVAQKVGCGRTSVMNAIKNGKLIAMRDNSNRWKITPEDAEKWEETLTKRVTKSVTDSAANSDSVSLAAAEATVAMLRSQIERDDKRHADEISRLETIIERLTAPKPTFLQRLFGASPR